jgi:hypothetical protein
VGGVDEGSPAKVKKDKSVAPNTGRDSVGEVGEQRPPGGVGGQEAGRQRPPVDSGGVLPRGRTVVLMVIRRRDAEVSAMAVVTATMEWK